jgi:hypothetical protein
VSGFLGTLSAQALGVAGPVKSMARLSYAPLPLIFDQPAGEAPIASEDGAPADDSDGAALQTPEPHGVAAPAGRRSHDGSGMAQTHDTGPGPSRAPGAALDPAHPGTHDNARFVAPPPLVEASTRHALPPAVVAPARPARESRAALQAPASDPGATEVHVTIGRIELTAVHEPGPRGRPAPAPSVTLNDYLARSRKARR